MKRKYLTLFFIMILFLPHLFSCDKTNEAVQPPLPSISPLPTYEEIYPEDIYTSDSPIHSFSTSAYDDVVISYMDECVRIIDLKNNFYVHELCNDPTCNHSNLSCLKYASRSCVSAIYHNNIVYLTRFIENETSGLSEELIAYDLQAKTFTVIHRGDFFTLLCRLGKFIYYYESTFVEQLDSGQDVYLHHYYRYDIVSGTSEFLYESKSENTFYSFISHKEVIYALNRSGDLIACDANFKFIETVLSGKNISVYYIVDESVYYLTMTTDKYGELHEYSLTSNDDKLIFENVTLFSCSGNTLYYTLYNPVPAFEWDYPVANENGIVEIRADGQHETHRVMIESTHGNEIFAYEIGVDSPEIRCYPIGNEDAYLGTSYYIRNGQIVTQFKAPYTSGEKLGMRSGVGIFDFENNFYPIIEIYFVY